MDKDIKAYSDDEPEYTADMLIEKILSIIIKTFEILFRKR
jgi:hypothetical protein